MLKAITFDFWNTLYKAAPYAFALRRKFLFEILSKNHIDVAMEQVDAAEDVARKEWNRIWREEYRTPPAAACTLVVKMSSLCVYPGSRV